MPVVWPDGSITGSVFVGKTAAPAPVVVPEPEDKSEESKDSDTKETSHGTR